MGCQVQARARITGRYSRVLVVDAPLAVGCFVSGTRFDQGGSSGRGGACGGW